MGNETTTGVAEVAHEPDGRSHVAVFLVPIGIVFAGALVSRAIWPSLLDPAPWSLLMLSSTWTRMLVVQPLVPAALFFSLALGRIALLAPLYFRFGHDYGDTALRWGEHKLGSSSTVIATTERYFRRFSIVLVACWWSAIVCIMAGATGMKARLFFPLIALGAVARVTLVYFVGDALAEPIRDFAEFMSRYALIFTPVTIAITGLQLWYSRRKNGGLPIGTVDDLEADFEETSLEVASEATVIGPPEPD